tara:strand:+ start:60658 stop:60834 length:177 start_codon:yes stop_codon:yes gene_type:complete
MTELILYHYEASLHSEKIRILMGFRGLSSVMLHRETLQGGTVAVHFPRLGYRLRTTFN